MPAPIMAMWCMTVPRKKWPPPYGDDTPSVLVPESFIIARSANDSPSVDALQRRSPDCLETCSPVCLRVSGAVAPSAPAQARLVSSTYSFFDDEILPAVLPKPYKGKH